MADPKTNTYRVAELLKKDSVRQFIESEWLDAVIELNQLNIDRGTSEAQYFGLNQYVINEGPGFDVLKGVHRIMYGWTRPLYSWPSDVQKIAPAWATRAGRGYLKRALKEILKDLDLSENQLKNLSSDSWKIMRLNNLAWKQGAATPTFFVREWPEGLTALNLQTYKTQTVKVDPREEKRIAEEAEKAETTIVVHHSLSALKPPNPKDPRSFVEFASAAMKIEARKDEEIADLSAKIEALEKKLDELENSEWEDAASEIEKILKGG